MPAPLRQVVLVFLVFAAYILAAFFKFNAFWAAPGFEKDHRTLYWTESAMHYYMADKVARGESLDGLDKRAQATEGIYLSRDIAPAMPWIAGTLYRLLSPAMPLDIFIAYLFIFYSSLTVVAVYLWGNAVFGGYVAGLVAAFLYAVSAPAFLRSTGAFIKEDLALPLLMLGFCFFFMSLRDDLSVSRRQRRWRALAAALLISAALLSWHFSQFMLLCFSAIFVLSLIVNGPLNRDQTRTLALYVGVLGLTAVLFPMLRATAFLFSPAMSLLYAALAYHLAVNMKKVRREALTLAVFLISVLVYFKSGLAEQSHVFGLVVDKLRFGFVKPTDPLLLSYETRSNWIEDFNSPRLYFVFYAVSFFLPLGLAGLVLLIQRGWRQRFDLANGAREKLFIAGYGTLFLIFFAMARRMITIDIIFLCLAAAGLLTVYKKPLRISIGVLLALVFVFETWKSYHYHDPNPVAMSLGQAFPGPDLPEVFTVAEHTDLLNWIRVNTDPDDTILASMGFSPVILAYTGRPIVIHSMFDAKEMRDKVQTYVESLYASEDRFNDFAQKNGVRYFVYESKNLLLNGPHSDRFVAGVMNPAKDSAVFNLQFHPENLKHFRLVYQNTAYRVFQSASTSSLHVPAKILPQPIYNEALLEGQHAEDLISFLQTMRNQMLLGFQYGGAGDAPTAIKHWEEVKRQAPYTIDVHAQLCLGYVITKNIAEATINCQTQMELQPHSAVGHYILALYNEQTLRIPEAIAELKRSLLIDPRHQKAQARLRKLEGR